MENKYKTIFYGVSAIVYLAITIYYIVGGVYLSVVFGGYFPYYILYNWRSN